MIDNNPAIGVKKYKASGDGFHSWTEAEIAQFEERHPIGTRARLAFALLLYTAQRRGDVVKMGWQQLQDTGRRHRRAAGENRHRAVPLHPDLAQALASAPRTHLTFLMTERAHRSRRRVWQLVSGPLQRGRLAARSAHGLRKAAATRLAECRMQQRPDRASPGIARCAEVAHYTRAADQQRLARQALAMQIGAEREQELSNPQTRLDKMSVSNGNHSTKFWR